MVASQPTVVGIDAGGTNIRAACVDAGGKILERWAEPVDPDRLGFSRQVLRLIDTARSASCVGVGIGIPGRVASQGEILSAGHLDIAALDLKQLIADEIHLPVRIENDATMALFAEANGLPAAGEQLIVMVTVGTGIGGSVLDRGQHWCGGGVSGQFGHIVVAEDGPRCLCGRVGCVETFSSGPALKRLLSEAGLNGVGTAEELIDGAIAGRKGYADVLSNWAKPFHRALETLAATLDPDLILIGGGLGPQMVRALGQVSSTGNWFRLPVKAARCGNHAGVVGAGLSVFNAAAGQTIRQQ